MSDLKRIHSSIFFFILFISIGCSNSIPNGFDGGGQPLPDGGDIFDGGPFWPDGGPIPWSDGGPITDGGAADDGGSPGDGGVSTDGGTPGDGGVTADGGAGDGGITCTPNPFVPQGSTTNWRHTSTGLLTVTMGAPNHRGQDVVVKPGDPQLLIGKFGYGLVDKDLKDEDVEIFIQENPPCGAWISLGVERTSEDGEYGTQYGIEDDGGRIFFTIPANKARPIGRYPIRMLVHGDHSMAAFTLIVTPAATDAVVCDIDGTLTTGDSEVIQEVLADLFNGSYIPEMRVQATNVVQAWADRGYLIVYLTGRPDLLRKASQTWLVDKGFPPGAVHLTDTNAQALPTSSGVAKYKTDYLNKLINTHGIKFYAAYGNSSTDIEAYENVSIPKTRTYIIGTNAGNGGTVAVDSYNNHLPSLSAMPRATISPPAAYGWW